MSVQDRKKMHGIFNNPNCLNIRKSMLEKVHNELNVPYSEMQHIRMIVECCQDYDGLIDIVKAKKVEKEATVAAEVKEVKQKMAYANDGLQTFQLKPQGLHGKDLFNHMLEYRAQHLGAVQPSKHLGINMSKSQRSAIMPSREDLAANVIMRDTQGLGAQLKISKRKLDNLGFIKSHSGIQNSEERIKRLKSQLKLSETLAEINAATDKEKGEKEETYKELLKSVSKAS